MRLIRFSAALVGLAALSSSALAAEGIDGRWRDSDGTSIIAIAPCGAHHCGTLAWTSKGDKDANNSDAALRNRPLVGVRVLWDLKRGADGVWSGTGYNPNDGKTYSTHVSVKSADRIEISGCILGGLLCDSDDFTRVP